MKAPSKEIHSKSMIYDFLLIIVTMVVIRRTLHIGLEVEIANFVHYIVDPRRRNAQQYQRSLYVAEKYI